MLVGDAIERGKNWKFLEFEAIFWGRGDPFEKSRSKVAIAVDKKITIAKKCSTF